MEAAEGPSAVSYPYILRTEGAVWHLSADDMELLGQEKYCTGLELLLQDQEADFAEARTLLAPWIWEEIPPIDIYTDFCGHAEGDEIFGAFYYGSRREIRLFHDWDLAARSLLHEYVHYLSFTCTDRPISEGLFGEGVAEYVSHFACRNRMDRNASKRALSPEELQMAAECHLLDEDGCMDPRRTYLYNAEIIRSPMALGAKYNTITSAVILIKAVVRRYAPAVVDSSVLLKNGHDLVSLSHDVMHVNKRVRHGVKAEAVNAAVPDLLRPVLIEEIPEALKLLSNRICRRLARREDMMLYGILLREINAVSLKLADDLFRKFLHLFSRHISTAVSCGPASRRA